MSACLYYVYNTRLIDGLQLPLTPTSRNIIILKRKKSVKEKKSKKMSGAKRNI